MMLMSFRYEPYLLPESFSPSEFDAICGWARQNFGHPGNKRLRDIINQNIPAYKKAKSKSDKGKVIVDLCKQLIMDSPTRTGFVKLDTKTGRWYFVGFEKSKEKIGHALRKAAQYQAKKNRRAFNEEGGAAGRSSHSDDLPESPSDHSSLDGFLHSPLVMAGSASRRRQEEDTPTSDEDRHQHSPRHHSIQRDTIQPLLSPVAESSSLNHNSVHSPLPPPRSLLPMQRVSSNNKEEEGTSHVLRFQIGEPSNMFLSSAALAAAEVAARESGMRDHHQNGHEEPSKNTTTTTPYQHANGASPMESPVRRSMFDSPMKPSPIDHHHHHHEPRNSIMVPLPLSSNHNMEDDDDDDIIIEDGQISPARLPPRQEDGRAMASSPMSHMPPPPPPYPPPPPPPPSYYYPYPPPPSGYMYYPVPIPIPAYPYHHHHHHQQQHYPPPLEPRPMAPSALRREPKYAPRRKKRKGDEQKDEP